MRNQTWLAPGFPSAHGSTAGSDISNGDRGHLTTL